MTKYNFLTLCKFIFLLLCLNSNLAESKERYALEEIHPAVERVNAEFSEAVQMYNRSTYNDFRYRDRRLPPWNTVANWYRGEYGDIKGLPIFIFFGRKPTDRFYTLKEIPMVVARLNTQSPEIEYMENSRTYEEFRSKDKDSKLPPWSTLVNWYKKEHDGDGRGLSKFVFPGKKLGIKRQSRFYALEEVPSAVANVNAKSSEEEQIRDVLTYGEFRSNKDPKLPSWSTLVNWYEKEHGDSQGLFELVFSEKFYPLEEVPLVVAIINAESLKKEQMRSIVTYEKFRPKDRMLPSWGTLVLWYKQKHGTGKGLSKFIFVDDKKPRRQSRFYPFKEIPPAVERINAESSEEEQITNMATYEVFRKKDPRLPSRMTISKWFIQEYGYGIGVSDFICKGIEPEPILYFYNLEEIPLVVARLNAESSKEEQMNTRSTYQKFYSKKDPRLPSWGTLANWFVQEYGNGKGLSTFIFFGREPDAKFYTLKEIPSVVARLNAESSKEEQMRSIVTYEKFHPKDRMLPSWRALANWYNAEYGDGKGLADFVFDRNCENALSSR